MIRTMRRILDNHKNTEYLVGWRGTCILRPFSRKVAYFGSDEFSVSVLSRILAEGSSVNKDELLILSTGKPENEQGQGRKNDLVKFAERQKLPVWIPVYSNIKEERIKQWRLLQNRLDQYCTEKGKFDLGIVCSYGNLIPSYLIEYFQGVE